MKRTQSVRRLLRFSFRRVKYRWPCGSSGFYPVSVLMTIGASGSPTVLKESMAKKISTKTLEGVRSHEVSKPQNAIRRTDGNRQRCIACGHPRVEHKGIGCSVPKCACLHYDAPLTREVAVEASS